MTKLLPYFKWYPADADTDANFRAMSDAEIGFYVRCLNHAWINGWLPADPVERARVLHTRLDLANRYWKRVGKCWVTATSLPEQLRNRFQETQCGSGTSLPEQLCNLRQETERGLASRISQVRSESAKARSKSKGFAHTKSTYSDSDSDTYANAAAAAAAADQDCASSTREREAENPPPQSLQQQQPRTRFEEKFPKTAEAIRESFPDADDVFVMKLASASVECTRSVNGAPLLEDPTDAVIADAVRHCRRDNQTSAGLFLSTVPQCVKTWCTSGRTAAVERKQPTTAMDRARILWKQREKERGRGAD